MRAKRQHKCFWEFLESRDLKSGIPTDYVLQGSKWASPAISYSIVPDGTAVNGTTSNLNQVMTRELGPAWTNNITRALSLWASAAPLRFSPVPDDGSPLGTPGATQRDPRFGDIRISGYDFGDNSVLARTYFPTPGTTLAGDVVVNTHYDWSTIDLASNLCHELGHSLGLGHAADKSEVMYPQYQGVVTQLGDGDKAGIQMLYGAVATPQPATPAPTPAPTPTTPTRPVPTAPTPIPTPATPVVPGGQPTSPGGLTPTPTPPKPLTPAQARAQAKARAKAARQAAKAKAAAARAARRAALLARIHHAIHKLTS